jgi:hypothetical protein
MHKNTIFLFEEGRIKKGIFKERHFAYEIEWVFNSDNLN